MASFGGGGLDGTESGASWVVVWFHGRFSLSGFGRDLMARKAKNSAWVVIQGISLQAEDW